MSTEIVAGLLFIVVPVAFNLAFFELGRAFDYPNILRESPDTILRKFDAGGSGLILRWEALLVSALAMLALVAILPAVAVGAPPAIAVASIVVGTAAAVVQAIGLIRWPYAIPELARRYVAADGPDDAAVRAQIETMFGTLHRLLGVGIGEHLGYLLTGAWTLLVAAAIMATADLPAWLGILGDPHRHRPDDRVARVRRPKRTRGLGRRRDPRADRLHRVVGLAHRAGDRPAPAVGAQRDRWHRPGLASCVSARPAAPRGCPPGP